MTGTARRVAHPFLRLWSWLGRHELGFLLAIGLAAAGVLAFVSIADEVMEGEAFGFDERLLLALRVPGDLADPLGPAWVEEAARDITALGSTVVLTLVTLAAIGFLLIVGKRHAAAVVAVATVGGTLLSTALKELFGRPRPELVPHAMETFTASFPSGHAMLSAVTWLTLGALLARFQPRRRVKAYILSLAVLLTLLVGTSRVYLGVHWPSDVLAGWSLGAAWAILCWLIAERLQREGKVETDPEPPENGNGA
ncbi:MAG: phosphatase PAP2 family protein [Geminicoccaceae bacterium]